MKIARGSGADFCAGTVVKDGGAGRGESAGGGGGGG